MKLTREVIESWKRHPEEVLSRSDAEWAELCDMAMRSLLYVPSEEKTPEAWLVVACGGHWRKVEFDKQIVDEYAKVEGTTVTPLYAGDS